MVALKVDLTEYIMVAGMVTSMVVETVGKTVAERVDRMVEMSDQGMVVGGVISLAAEMVWTLVRLLAADLVYLSVVLKAVEMGCIADLKWGVLMENYSAGTTESYLVV